MDDAELVDDADQLLARSLASADAGLRVVAAGRPDALRSGYGHWTQLVRRSRLGILLQPDLLVDGDLLGVTLPRHRPFPRLPGRGYLVAEGRVEMIQLARPDAQAGAVEGSSRPAQRRIGGRRRRQPGLQLGSPVLPP